MELVPVDPRIVVDLRYATANNFVGRAVYNFDVCLVLEPVAKALSRVQDRLETLGMGLKIWDGYRPFSVQELFWEIVQDDRYVAPPSMGGRHTRGTAVDVTLVDKEGRELDMPTPFDEFSDRAHRIYVSEDPLKELHTRLLEKVMKEEGFIGLATEWWHFDFQDWQNYPVLFFDPVCGRYDSHKQ
ncbi:MAG: M15 family metallopeptidase [Chlamydiae bacterium]|nr:M15 family metallopeptidase [Chlamydiota bacterium]